MTDTACYHLTCGHYAAASDSDEYGEAKEAYCAECKAIRRVAGWTSRTFVWDDRLMTIGRRL